jgi:molybdopterin converting factor small subunit
MLSAIGDNHAMSGVEKPVPKSNYACICVKAASGGRGAQNQFLVPAGSSLLEALESLNLPVHQPLIAVANGVTVDLTYILKPGDFVNTFPQIAGG